MVVCDLLSRIYTSEEMIKRNNLCLGKIRKLKEKEINMLKT